MNGIAIPNHYRGDTSGGFTAAATGIAFGYVAILAIFLLQQKWILTAGGVPMPSDFLAYRAAGVAALRGNAASVYDPHAFHVLQNSLTRPFTDYYYWNYPPLFFYVVSPLALLAYVPAYLVWIATTGIACALVLGRIARTPQAIVFALASPIFLVTAYVGQNGFLSAALMGGFLLCLRKRPAVAGILLALMTYKPQLGILFSLALIAGGYWRALGWAIAATAFVTIAAGLTFGAESYVLFFRSLADASRIHLTLGGEGWAKIESMYSVTRFLGGGDHAAWIVQGLASAVCALGVLWLWRSDKAYELKAAGLLVAAILSIPYLHQYDFPVILVAFAFLYRQRAFGRAEWIAVGATNILMAVFIFELAPIGPVVAMIAGGLVLWRVAACHPRTSRAFAEREGDPGGAT